MKVLFVVQHFPCLSETFILNQITGLIDAGHDVRIYALGKPDTSILHEDIIKYNLIEKTFYPIVEIPCSKKDKYHDFINYFPRLVRRYGLNALSVLNRFKFGEYAKNGNLFYSTLLFLKLNWIPDIAVTHFGCLGLYPACWKEMKALNVPFVTFFHAHEISPYTIEETAKRYKVLFDQNDLLFPISNYWKKKLVKCGANPSRVIVHRMGVDIEQFVYTAPRKINRKINILSVGRLTGQKGYEYAIKGVADFRKRTPLNISYRIIGAGTIERKLKQMVKDLGVDDIIHFIGPQPLEVVKKELAKADVFLLPSISDQYGLMEGIPVAIMESMAIGLPVISTFHSGIPEIIDDGISGFLCEEKNHDDITEKLTIISKNYPLVKMISKNARKKVEAEYNIKSLNNKLIYRLSQEYQSAAV